MTFFPLKGPIKPQNSPIQKKYSLRLSSRAANRRARGSAPMASVVAVSCAVRVCRRRNENIFCEREDENMFCERGDENTFCETGDEAPFLPAKEPYG